LGVDNNWAWGLRVPKSISPTGPGLGIMGLKLLGLGPNSFLLSLTGQIFPCGLTFQTFLYLFFFFFILSSSKSASCRPLFSSNHHLQFRSRERGMLEMASALVRMSNAGGGKDEARA
jgi:hypothetical protein